MTQPKNTHPNWQVDPFLAWIQSVSMASWDLEKEISGEEKEKVMGCWLMQLARMDALTFLLQDYACN